MFVCLFNIAFNFYFLFVGFVLDITASSPQHALLGNEVHLRCTFSVAKPPINPLFLAVFWYFQDTEILRYDNKGLSISPRVTFSKEAANNGDVSLSLANVTISDGGLYKCLVIYSPEKMEREVLLEIFVSPVIQIPNKVIQKNKENTLTCMANCFYPVDINIIWYKDNEPLTNSELGKPERNPDGTYRVMGTVTLPPMDGKMDHNFSCKVQHASLQQPLQEDFQLEYEASLQGYTVSEIKGPEKLLDGEETTLYCTVSNCPQEDPQVTWIEERSGDQWEIPQCRDPGEAEQLLGDSYLITCRKEGLQSYCSSLRFVPRVGKHRDVTLICRFVCAEKTKEKRFHCTNIYAKPMFLDPVQMDLLTNGRIQFSITLRNFYPRDIHINWSQGEKEAKFNQAHTDTVTQQQDLTYNITSVCSLPGHLFSNPEYKVHVTWNHVTMEAPESRELWVGEILVPTLGKKKVTLSCKISGYFPDALTVSWFRKGKSDQSEDPLSKVGTFLSNLFRKEKGDQLKPDLTAQCDGSVITDICTKEKEEQSELTMSHYSDWSQMTEVYKEEEKEDQSETSLSTRHYKVSEAKSQKQEDQTFTCETQLTFSPDQKTDQGAEFICRVGEIVVPTLGKKKVTLSCKISGYFPDALTVSWFRREKSDQSEVPLASKVATSLFNLFRKEKGDQLKPDLTAQCDGSVITEICTKEKEEQSELTMSQYSDLSQMTEVYKKEEKEDQSETSLSTRQYKVSEAKSQNIYM
ncbi:hypothetical protein XELAEV_18003415mg [Xenopus laevis]|nr:hypothetical protein XELAEV_18003415mg [Xenopus laevis]